MRGEESRRRDTTVKSSHDSKASAPDIQGPARGRRVFRWSKEARDLVHQYQDSASPLTNPSRPNPELRELVTKLVNMTGHPRGACLRFVRQLGVDERTPHKDWTDNDKQRLLDLSARFLLREVARLMSRSYSSVRSMLHRLGATARMGQDWFTVFVLADALHIDIEEVQRWIDRGWLKCTIIPIGNLKRVIITADNLEEFCRKHGRELAGRRRIPWRRLEFLTTFIFPPSHAELLPVRDSKKERAAYEEQAQTAPKISPQSDSAEPNEASEWAS